MSSNSPPTAPTDVRQRVTGTTYTFNGDIRVWTGHGWNCKHNKPKGLCAECGGGKLCEHGKQRVNCMPCGGCPHGKKRSRCAECGGVGVCSHGKRKGTCVPCGGMETCSHGRVRSQCRECNGQRFCQHGTFKPTCKQEPCVSSSSSICEHSLQRHNCKECWTVGTGGASICVHGLQQATCYKCDGAQVCVCCKHTLRHKTFKPNCAACHYYLHPETEGALKYKMKETHLYRALIAAFPDHPLVWDKRIEGGCSARRPDFRWECLTHSIVVECDEQQHTHGEGYAQECENRRTMEIWLDLGSRPLVLIRFNPDGYVDDRGIRIRSCFKDDGSVVSGEWNVRFATLKSEITTWLQEVPLKEAVTQVNMYYSSMSSSTRREHLVERPSTTSGQAWTAVTVKSDALVITRGVVVHIAPPVCISLDSSIQRDREKIRELFIKHGEARLAALARAKNMGMVYD